MGRKFFVEEVSEAMCLSYELNIMQWIFFWVVDLNFSTHDMIPFLGSRERNQIIFICIRRWWKVDYNNKPKI